MSPEILFIIIFFGIILAATIFSLIWVNYPKHIVHTCDYKKSKDYERLWDLIINQNAEVVIIDYTDRGGIFRYNNGHRYDDHIYGCGEKFYIKKGKEAFIGYCVYRDIVFLDPIYEKK